VLRAGIAAWRSAPGPPGGPLPDAASAAARHLEAAVARLADHPRLRAPTLARLPSRLRGEVRDLGAARDDLRRLSAGWPAHRVRTGPPTPLAELRRSYRGAQRRFGVDWSYLAAINLVESAFGRVRSRSVAGAQGPMQFMPSSWRAYGLGGNIEDPGDAILGAANLLSRAGAPGSYARALYAYNPSHLYVDAVRRYAGVIGRDPDGLYLLYSWPAG
jgi:soluble lytic murein transglycosylase-like protein